MLPMGFDSFGLPAENAAIDRGVHPADWTNANIDRMRAQFRTMGASWDWSREVIASDPEFYRWTQWLFLQFFKAGLAYKAMAAVDWCPRTRSSSPGSRSWARSAAAGVRHAGHQARPGAVVLPDHEVRRRAARLHRPGLARADPPDAEQTGSADPRAPRSPSRWRLVGGPGRTRPMDPSPSGCSRPGRTRRSGPRSWSARPGAPDGAATHHRRRRAEVEAYVAVARRDRDRPAFGGRERTGVFIGAYAVNPLTDEPVPVWVDYVLPGYGTGAIMGVPATTSATTTSPAATTCRSRSWSRPGTRLRPTGVHRHRGRGAQLGRVHRHERRTIPAITAHRRARAGRAGHHLESATGW